MSGQSQVGAGDTGQLQATAEDVAATPFEIPGATGGRFRIQILNQDAERGVVTSVVHLPAGGRIPAHRHRAGAEMHYVLDGDLVERGRTLGPGAFLTHAAGVVHGPHESRGGARVLTVQQWQSRDGEFDFEPVEESTGAGGGAAAAGAERPDDAAAAAPSAGQAPGGGVAAGDETRAEAERALGKGYS
jgi:quercetin dioxygenase-like cupin family protein